MSEKIPVGPDEKVSHAEFYLIFDQLAEPTAEDYALANEIDAIEQISRMVQDASADEEPRFLSST